MARNGRELSDAYEEGKKQGRADMLEELAATKVLVSIIEYEALRACEAAARNVRLAGNHMQSALTELDKARGK